MKSSNGSSGHGIGDEQDYVETERTGRTTTRVARADRAVVFDLYQRYLTHRGRANKLYDWTNLAGAVHRELQSDADHRRYRHVVIDEGQDFSPEMLRSLALAVPADGSLTFFGDMAQQIYGHRISWRSAGLSAHNIWRFEENYRNTRQISRLAIALAKMPHFPGRSRSRRADLSCRRRAAARAASIRKRIGGDQIRCRSGESTCQDGNHCDPVSDATSGAVCPSACRRDTTAS